MDLEAQTANHGSRWAWPRIGALVLFLLTAILLVASLDAAKNDPAGASLRIGSAYAVAMARN